MDMKSMAKSKRSHTQHHKKSHKPPNKTNTPPTSGNNNTTQKQQIKKKETQKLPSNWERYEEEGEENDDLGQVDVIKPKSKGADYKELISQAQENDAIYSLDDILHELNQGLGSMLSVRGQRILSWTADDNFIVEDKATTSREATFFSLNLNTLAEQLANVDLSQRLFIEADLLPPELCAQGSEANRSKESEMINTKFDEETTARTAEGMTCEQGTIARDGEEALSSEFFMNQAKEKNDIGGEYGQCVSAKFAASINTDSCKTSPVFQPTDAEAELDMLLDSFSQTDFTSSSGLLENQSKRTTLQEETTMLQPQCTIEIQGPSKMAPVSANFDDDLDELLATSNPINQGETRYHKATTATLDDNIDDLLEETSSLMNRNGATQAQKFKNDLLINSSSSGSKPKMLDDFDAWMETI